MRHFEVAAGQVGQRADKFLAGQYPEFTRSSLGALFERGFVMINDKPAKPSQTIKVSDSVKVDETLLKSKPPKIDLPILYEDEDVLVIDKPAGILTHSKGALNSEATVASFIEPKLQGLSGNRAGIVHRLDRPTSGVIITAKTSHALAWLQKQFSARKTKKTYLAVVEGKLEPKQAIIDAPIARNPKKPQTFYVNSGGKPAVTEYKVIKELETSTLTELKPLTGRTHQLRVHIAYINHPIVGDGVYGHPAEHLLLHAKSLELTLPNHQRLVFEAPLPAYFKEYAQL